MAYFQLSVFIKNGIPKLFGLAKFNLFAQTRKICCDYTRLIVFIHDSAGDMALEMRFCRACTSGSRSSTMVNGSIFICE